MSVILEYKILVRGEAQILEEFARIFEHEYVYKFLNDEFESRVCSSLDGCFINSNCYLIEIGEYYREISNVIDLDGLVKQFPSLRFDCLDIPDSSSEMQYYLYLGGSLIEDYWGDFLHMSEREYGFLSQDFISRDYIEGYDKWAEINELKDIEWCIYKKDFPCSLPSQALGYDLKVINKQGYIEAYFYRIGFILKENTFSSPEAFCSYYDQLFEDYLKWCYAGVNLECRTPQEQIEDYRSIAQSLRWNPYTLSQIQWTDFPIKLMGLYRLAYPYYCNVEKLKEILLQIDGYIRDEEILDLHDIQVLRIAFELEWIEFQDFMPVIIENRWIYEHPEYWLSAETIDYIIDYARETNNSGLMNFLMNYRIKNFSNSTKSRTHTELWSTIPNFDGSLVITKYNGNAKDIEIPSVIKSVRIKQIWRQGWWHQIFNNRNIKSVKIEEGIEIIGPSTFEGCKYLKSVDFPNTLRIIHGSAFDGCEELKYFCIPEGVKEICAFSFHGCTAVTELSLPSGLIRIALGGFEDCQNLQSLTIPFGVMLLENQAFRNCSKLESLILPDSITYIGYFSFAECANLEFIVIPESVKEIKRDAFKGCNFLSIIGELDSPAHQFALENGIPFVERNLVYGSSPLGLIFLPESRARELAEFHHALVTARTWGEFREMVSTEIYEFYLKKSVHHQGPDESPEDLKPFYIPDKTPFNPNDVFTYDHLPGHPEIEMSEWMPSKIKDKFGREFSYSAMDTNVPKGKVLELDKDKVSEIVSELEKLGFVCRQDDNLVLAATTFDYDPDAFSEPPG